jgi:hypothetical protein
LKNNHIQSLKAKNEYAELRHWYNTADCVGLDYGANVRSYSQVNEDDLIESYLDWHVTYSEDSTLANQSFQKAHEESIGYVKTDEKVETVDNEAVKQELRKHRKRMPDIPKDVKW